MKIKKKNKRRLLVAGCTAAFIILYIIVYIVPQVSDIFVKTYSAEYGTLEIWDECDYLAVRDEKVYTADNSGTVERVIPAGSLMRRNSHIVTVGGTSHYSQTRGIISYYYDGYESIYTPDNLDRLAPADLKADEEGSESHQVKECVKGSASSGDVVFKVVDNKEWYMVFWLTSKQAKGIEEGAQVKVEFDDGLQVPMDVRSITYQNGAAKTILVCDRYYKKYDRIRRGTCKIIKSQNTGIILENDSIVKKDGKTGVYVVNKIGNYNFVPVQILAADDSNTVVTSENYLDYEGNLVETVEPYQEVLREPPEDKAGGNDKADGKNTEKKGSEKNAD